jgi:NAD(P)-dependent dehydrogenase (short-subunit alcohol dehydrogenase family)
MRGGMTNGGKTVLITGATSGIGKHCALHLARRGHRVFATGRRMEALDALMSEAAGARIETLALDVADSESIKKAREEIVRSTEGRGIDVLVNNAGYGVIGPVESLTPEDLQAQFRTNFFGLLEVTRAFLPEMKTRKWGRIINISSLAGRIAIPFQGAYCASKFALEGVSDAMRMELSPFGVRVVLVEPGAIASNFENRILVDETRTRFEKTPYAKLAEGYFKLIRRAYKLASGPACVTARIEHAIDAANPPARYMAPFYMWSMMVLKIVLPTFLQDLILRVPFGITKRILPKN